MRKLGRERAEVAAQCGQSCGPSKRRPAKGSGDRGHTHALESSVCGQYLKPCEWARSLVERVLGEKEGC